MAFWIPSISSSTPDAIDLFCGYGGWSTAAGALGIWVRRALNHWQHAIEVHHANHPLTNHFLGDVRETNPREHPHTAIFMGSPTCTDFSQADPENVKTLANENQLRMFDEEGNIIEDYEADYEKLVAQHQGRATMFDVIKFAACHRYHYGVIENVWQVHKWALFDRWQTDLRNLGYELKFLHLNSMFFHSLNGVENMPIIPQSRDRWYCVFWRKGDKAPELDFRPLAPCPNCGDIRAIQVWKNPEKQWGKYGLKHGRYYYGCPICKEKYRGEFRPLPVEPYYYAGISAVDFTVPIRRVDDPDREQPVSPATIERIRRGLEKYGHHPLVLDVQRTQDGHVKTHSALLTPLFTQTKSATQTVAIPPTFITDAAYYGGHIWPGTAPLPAQTSGADSQGIAVAPFFVTLGGERETRPITEALNTQTAAGSKNGLVMAPLFFIELYGNGGAREATDAINTVTAQGGKTGLATPAFFVERPGPGHCNGRDRTRGIDEPLNTATAGGVRTGLAVPFFVTYNGHSVLAHGGQPLATMTTVERHGMTWPKARPEECYYRTLRSKIKKTGAHGATYITSEIGAAMGFPQGPDGYRLDPGYSTDDITAGYGNAITPGAGYWPIKQILKAMS